MNRQRFRKFGVWIRSMEFISQIYRHTASFPASETYGLSHQLRRASTSIALNIAEGSGSGSDAEFKRFINIALRSTYEVICGLEIAGNLGYLVQSKKEKLLSSADEISAMLTSFKKTLSSGSLKKLRAVS